MSDRLYFLVKVQTKNPLNSRQHWRAVAKRARHEKAVTQLSMRPYVPANLQLPCVVKLTRLSSRRLDQHDGLRAALKHIADAVSEWVGIDDGDRRIQFLYEQEPCKRAECGVRIEIYPGMRLEERMVAV